MTDIFPRLKVVLVASAALSCSGFGHDQGNNNTNSNEPAAPSVPVNKTSIAPSTTMGRPNQYLGCIDIAQRSVSIQAWDHGTVDGDIISLIANGDQIANQVTLAGPSSKWTKQYTFTNNGFNYLTLFAHNLGDISPNTAAISINGREFVLEANLQANGYVDVVVEGYGVSCSSSGGGGGTDAGTGGTTGCTNTCAYANDGECDDGGPGVAYNECALGTDCNDCGPRSTGGGGTATTGSVIFWTSKDFGCGNITVNLQNAGSGTISSYYSSTPTCGAPGSANFSSVSPGTWSFTASCSSRQWSGSLPVTAGQCSTMHLQ
jgi:hypothetical protein